MREANIWRTWRVLPKWNWQEARTFNFKFNHCMCVLFIHTQRALRILSWFYDYFRRLKRWAFITSFSFLKCVDQYSIIICLIVLRLSGLCKDIRADSAFKVSHNDPACDNVLDWTPISLSHATCMVYFGPWSVVSSLSSKQLGQLACSLKTMIWEHLIRHCIASVVVVVV